MTLGKNCQHHIYTVRLFTYDWDKQSIFLIASQVVFRTKTKISLMEFRVISKPFPYF